VQVCHIHVLWNVKKVAAHITLGVFFVDSGSGMQGLVKISHIVDEKAESEGLLLISPVDSARYIPVDKVVLEVTLLLKPIIDVFNGFNYAVWIIFELRVVLKASTLVKVGGVNEMPVILPFLAGLLDLISESSAFNEWIVEFRSDCTLVRVRIHLQQVICLPEDISSLSRELELLICYSGYKDVAVLPEGMD